MDTKMKLILLLGVCMFVGLASSSPEKDVSKTFLYFAYGSNMLTKRIHVNNPTAVQKHIGKLKNHKLDFNLSTKLWKGAGATIVPSTSDSEVWGVIWEIGLENLDSLDRQELVSSNVYFRKNVTVHTPEGQEIECMVYQQCNLPDHVAQNLLPPKRQPSYAYLKVMVNGAKSFNIPTNYINYLQSFPNNGIKKCPALLQMGEK